MRLIHRLISAIGGSDGFFPGIAESALYLPLTNTLVPTRGTSTPTFARNTNAWEFDNEGKLILIPSGAARFGGARLVRNLVTGNSEDFSTAAWSATNVTKAINSITSTAGSAVQGLGLQTLPSLFSGNTYVAHFRVQYNASQRFAQVAFGSTAFPLVPYANFDLLNISVVASVGCTAQISIVSSGIYDLFVTAAATVTTTSGPIIAFINSGSDTRLQAFTGGAGKIIGLLRCQFEDVSGQADTTASEYVSVGVLSSPYHGAGTASGADGCKWFKTHKNGSAITDLRKYHPEPARTNNCLWGRDLVKSVWTQSAGIGSELVTNGTFDTDISGWTDYNSSSSWSSGKISIVHAASASGAYRTFATVAGKTYTAMADIVSSTGFSSHTVLRVGNGTFPDAGLADSSAYTAPETKSVTFKATSTTSYVYLRNVGSYIIVWDNVSVKEAAIQVTTTTGLDNIANSASRLTSAATDATIKQLLSSATGSRAFSAYIKRVSGTGTVSLTRNGGTAWTDITSSLVTGTWVPVSMVSDVGANATVGIKMGMSGDVIDVDCCQDETGAWRTSPIVTTTAAVTRNADVMSYASAFDVTQGTALCSVKSDVPHNTSDIYFLNGDSGNARIGYLLTAVAKTTSYAYDGATTTNATGNSVTSSVSKRASRWGPNLQVCADGTLGAQVAFDGSMGAVGTLYVGCNQASANHLSGNIGEIHAWLTALTDAQMQQVTS